MTLEATFPKTKSGRNLAEYRWSDGTVAVTSSNGRAGRLPHDLEHYALESQVDLPYGFWALVGKQTPFQSFRLVAGSWPRGARERLARDARKHPGAMLQAEAGLLPGLPSDEDELRREWPAHRKRLARVYSYEGESPLGRLAVDDVLRMVARYRQLWTKWDRVPVGGALRVTWPASASPVIVPPREVDAALLG